ncbi:MAG: 5-(carboxyamino)imidazole ribonucleotide synthase [Clostridium sp.]
MNINNTILPPAKIGVIGGGQLGRMLAFEAKRMGYNVIVLDPKENCPAAQVCDEQIVGSLYDASKIRELAEKSDVLTYEFEFLDANILCDLENDGYKVVPSGKTLKIIQNKYTQKTFFREAGFSVPRFIKVSNKEELEKGIDELGLPVVLKFCTGGYDGKGNIVIKNKNEIDNILKEVSLEKGDFILEEFINFKCEISIAVARNIYGQVEFFPVGENIHEESILRYTKVPANISKEVEEKAKKVVCDVIEAFDDIGLICVELFVSQDDELYINEVAPRTHNSTHYTIEACVTSQFEQQLRAVVGLPLGSTKLISPVVMANLLGEDKIEGNFKIEGLDNILKVEGTYFHFYGKSFIDVKKKIGHITILDNSVEGAEAKAKDALSKIKIKGIKG